MPLQIIALEPERKVGSTADNPGFPPQRLCTQLAAGNDPNLKFRVEGLPDLYRTMQEEPKPFAVRASGFGRTKFPVAGRTEGRIRRVHASLGGGRQLPFRGSHPGPALAVIR